MKTCHACKQPVPPKNILIIDEARGRIAEGRHNHPICNQETLLLRALTKAQGVTVPRERLEVCIGIAPSRSHLNVVVARLRKKVGPSRIVTVPRIGYYITGKVETIPFR